MTLNYLWKLVFNENNSNRVFRIWFPKLDLAPLGRSTFRRHLAAAFCEGVFFGVIFIAGYLMRKQLQATDFQVTLLFALPSTLFIFSSIGASFLTQNNHRRLILIYGLLGRLAIAALLFDQHPYLFIGLISWMYLNHALFLPAQNMIFRGNYKRENRGACYARAQMVSLTMISVTALCIGRLFERDSDLFPYVFAVAAVFGFLSYFLFFSMPRDQRSEKEAESTDRAPRNALFGEFFQIMRKDVFFRKYESIFFLYGCGFMITAPMVPLFINDALHANWEDASLVFGVVHPPVMIVCLPLFGWLLDRKNVLPVAALAYLCLAFWPLTLASAVSVKMAVVAYVFFGLGLAGVDIAWNLGAITFSDKKRPQAYMAVHVSLVGLRALIAPWIGLVVMQNFGFRAAFSLSATLMLIASALMLRLHRERTRALFNGTGMPDSEEREFTVRDVGEAPTEV